jgi:hypothetical protein
VKLQIGAVVLYVILTYVGFRIISNPRIVLGLVIVLVARDCMDIAKSLGAKR